MSAPTPRSLNFPFRRTVGRLGPLARRARTWSSPPWLTRAVGYFPWTPLGVTAAAAALWAVRQLAYEELDLVWLVVGLACLALVALSALWVLPVAIYLAVRDEPVGEREPLSLETGVARDTGYRLPALRLLPLVQVEGVWRAPAQIDLAWDTLDGRLREHAIAHERGRHVAIVRRLQVSDPFGLARVHLQRRCERAVDVLPRLGGLARLPTLSSLAAGDELPHPLGLADGDRVELSRYVPGDPARFIHWKVFVRSRELMVRRPERALSVARRVAAFFVVGEDDDATAGLARLALARNLLGEQWRFGTAGNPGGTGDVGEALRFLMDSIADRERGAEGMDAFYAAAERSGPAARLAFVPPRPGPWLARVVHQVRGRRVRILIAVDALVDAPPTSRLRRFARFWMRPEADLPTTRDQLSAVVETLQRAGCAVSVFDRARGARLVDGLHARVAKATEVAA